MIKDDYKIGNIIIITEEEILNKYNKVKFKVNDKVIFKKISNVEYAWKLNNGNTYTIKNAAYDEEGKIFYALESDEGQYLTWYLEKDFVSLKKSRIDKLKKINFRNLATSKGYRII